MDPQIDLRIGVPDMTSPAEDPSSHFAGAIMPRNALLVILIFSLSAILAIGQQQTDSHLTEPGTAVLVARSAFAHGYRHGYEAGYHLGNIDANMARPQRPRLTPSRKIPMGYQPEFGSRHSFEHGFQSGLKAGYSDGYAGRSFRAIAEFRSLSTSLNGRAEPAANDAPFDNGVLAGYTQGLDHAPSSPSAADLDFHLVSCPKSAPSGSHGPTPQTYCDGYQRGYVLGWADGAILGPEHGLLEASR